MTARVSEGALQAAAVQFLAVALPPDAVPHHSPNEGKRGAIAQGKLKRDGVTAGWPDIEIVWQGRAIFVELKSSRGQLSPAQRATHARLAEAGAPVAVCRSIEDVAAALIAAGVPLRARMTVRA